MELPASVKAASERADALIKQQDGSPETGAVDNGASNQNTPSGTAQPNGEGQQPAAQDPPQQKAAEDFEAKYRTLQGKYNAEIPRLNQQIRTLQEQANSLTEENARLNEAGGKANTDSNGSAHIDPELLGEYGDEFEVVANQLNRLIDENAQLRDKIGSIQQTQGKTRYEAYIEKVAERLREQGREFNQLNTDPDFLTWLQESHPFTGKPRHVSLRDTEKAMDVERTIRIFEEYLGATLPAQAKQSPPQHSNIQPSHKASGSDVRPPIPGSNARIWTRADISKLYGDRAKGLYKGREADFKALEVDLFAAQKEGRTR